jgi:hypothetical protein
MTVSVIEQAKIQAQVLVPPLATARQAIVFARGSRVKDASLEPDGRRWVFVVWWQCHWRIILDHLHVSSETAVHVLGSMQVSEAVINLPAQISA